MNRRHLLGALLAAFAAPALAQSAPAGEAPRVAIETSMGRIVVALDPEHAPMTSDNFLDYVETHRFDGESFYRAMKSGDGGLIQGGIRSDARKLFAPIAHEPTSSTGLRNVAGAISMANAGPGTARADFFIMASDMPSLDASAGDPGFAVFGRVVEGMDVVRAILAAPVSATKGEGAMKGQMLDPPVKIIRVTRVKATAKP